MTYIIFKSGGEAEECFNFDFFIVDSNDLTVDINRTQETNNGFKPLIVNKDYGLLLIGTPKGSLGGKVTLKQPLIAGEHLKIERKEKEFKPKSRYTNWFIGRYDVIDDIDERLSKLEKKIWSIY